MPFAFASEKETLDDERKDHDRKHEQQWHDNSARIDDAHYILRMLFCGGIGEVHIRAENKRINDTAATKAVEMTIVTKREFFFMDS